MNATGFSRDRVSIVGIALGIALIAVLLGLSAAGCAGNQSANAGSGGATAATGGAPTGTGATTAGTGGGAPTGTGATTAGTGGSTAGTGGTTAGTGGATAGSDGGVPTNDLGKACVGSADCGGGLVCLKSTDKVLRGAGGPANGYCSSACVQGDGKCQILGGVCAELRAVSTDASQAYCLRSCTFGSADTAAKCHGRPDVGCLIHTAATKEAYCLPACSYDGQCDGRKCNLQTGMCEDTPPAGDPVGTHCAIGSDAGADNCAGVCLQLGATVALATFCSMRCVLGQIDGCGAVPMSTSLAGSGHGLCVLSTAGSAVGDMGFCTQQCDSANDCVNKADPGATCMPTAAHGGCFWSSSTTDAGQGG